jgi:hypothetical protein
MTPEIAANVTVLNEPLACWMVDDSSTIEVSAIDRFLDILATAEIPGTGEQVQVAIENQYGTADPDHFGRLVGWYMPETGAQMGVLIAEGFEPQLVKAVQDGQIIRPRHGLWLIEASGFLVGDTPVVTYTVKAFSLPRSEWLDRTRAFNRGAGAGTTSRSRAEDQARAAALFEHLATTSAGWLGDALRRSAHKTGYYRWIIDHGSGINVPLFVGVDRISVGSAYLKGSRDDATLEALSEANTLTSTDPEPDTRYLRGVWWDLNRTVGRATIPWPDDLGASIEAAYAEIRSAVEAHQAALLAASSR